MSWHADQATLARYADGRLEAAEAFSVEAHLPACQICRDRLAGAVDLAPLDRVWDDVVDRVDGSRLGPGERLLTALGLPSRMFRLLAGASGVRLSWLLAVAVALGFAVLAAQASDGDFQPFLLVAPILPVIGVAFAYAPSRDPIYEISLASPTGGFRLLLIRATAVLAVSVAMAAVASIGLPSMGVTAAAWLLPSLALTSLTLAVSTTTSVTRAAWTVGILWVVGITTAGWVQALLAAGQPTAGPSAAFGASAQAVFGVVIVASLAILFARRQAVELRDRL